jgi:hypothetical protein
MPTRSEKARIEDFMCSQSISRDTFYNKVPRLCQGLPQPIAQRMGNGIVILQELHFAIPVRVS